MLQSKTARQFLLFTPLWLMMEYVISYILTVFLSDTHTERWLLAFLVMGGLYIFRIANAIINTLLSIPMYYLTKQQRINAVVALLYANKIPATEEMSYKDGCIEVFQSLLSSDSVDEKAKLFVSTSLGELAGIRLTNKMVTFVQAQSIIDGALEQYLRERNAQRTS